MQLVNLSKYQYFNLIIICFIVGVLLGNFVHYRPIVIIFSLGFLVLCLNLKPIRIITLGLIFSFIGIYYFGFYKTHLQPKNLNFDHDINFQGVVLKIENQADKQNLVIKTTSLKDNTKIQIFSTIQPKLGYGDLVEIKGQLEKPRALADFDYPSYLEKQGIFALIYRPTEVRLIESHKGNKLIAQILLIKEKFEKSLNHSLPEPYSSLTAGILLGSKQSIPQGLTEQLNRVGLSHIVAVSGSNLTIIVTILIGLGIGRTIRFRYWALTLFIIFFVILTGASASIVRGGLVAWLSIWARANSRIAWPGPLLLTTMALMIIQNPLILKNDLGFQLSTAAFFGILFIAPAIKERIRFSRFNQLPDYLKLSAIETFSATLPAIPLTAFYFGRISLISLITNIFVLWTIPIIMALGFIVGILGIINPIIASLSAQPLVMIEKYILWIIEFTSAIPYASIDI